MDVPDLSRAVWRKSSRSGNQSNCVEVAGCRHVVAVRDSKDPDGPKLFVGVGEWRGFVRAIKAGQLDLPLAL